MLMNLLPVFKRDQVGVIEAKLRYRPKSVLNFDESTKVLNQNQIANPHKFASCTLVGPKWTQMLMDVAKGDDKNIRLYPTGRNVVFFNLVAHNYFNIKCKLEYPCFYLVY